MPGTIFSDINPTTTSGTDLANLLNAFKDAFASGIKGSSRPTNLVAGGTWIDDTLEGSPDYLLSLKIYDGSNDITLLTVNINTNTVSISDANAIFTISKISADAVGPILKLIKERIASNGQTNTSDGLGAVQFIGCDDTGANPVICEIKAVSNNDTTATLAGGYLVFSATDTGSATMLEKMRLLDGKLGIGTTAPEASLHTVGTTGIRSQTAAADNTTASIITGRKKRLANSGKVLSGDGILKVQANSTDDAGTEISDAVTLEVSATENHTSTAHGSKLDIYVKKIGQTAKTLMATFADTITLVPDILMSGIATFDSYIKIKSPSVARYISVKSPASIAASYDLTLPADAGTDGYVLTRDTAAGTTKWSAITLSNETRNEFVNANMALWQRSASQGTGAALTVANTQKKYYADFWCVRNALGTNGVITNSKVTAANDGVIYGNKLQITTAPTSAQANGCELYYVFENIDALKFYNKTCSFNVKVKSFGSVNQVGVQFMYATSETIPTSGIGSETTTTVNTASFTDCTILAQAIGTAMTTAGVIGVRIRITGVSSGNTYDLNNGFVIECPVMNVGSTVSSFAPREKYANELVQAQRRFIPMLGMMSAVAVNATTMYSVVRFPAPLRSSPTYSQTAAFKFVGGSSGSTITQSSASLSVNIGDATGVEFSMGNFSGLTAGQMFVPDFMLVSDGRYITADADIY